MKEVGLGICCRAEHAWHIPLNNYSLTKNTDMGYQALLTIDLPGANDEQRKIFYDEFEKYIHGFSQRLMVKPGLTGWAQVHGPRGAY